MIDLRRLTPAQIEAYRLALSAENNDLFKDKLKRFEKEENQKFSDSMGSYRASAQEKETFQDLLSQYLAYVENTHRSFFGTGCKKQTNGQLEFANKTAYTNFCDWLEKSGIANTKFSNFKQEFNDKVREVLSERNAQADRNAKKNKRRLKGLGAILAAGALGTAAIFGTKAVMEKFQNSEDDDAKTDRIEHRVNTNKGAVNQGKSYDFIETTDTYASPVQSQYVTDVETVVEQDVHEQVEEVTIPQPPQIIEKTVVIEKEVPQIIEKTVVKEVPTYIPVPQPTVEQQVEANTVAYQTAMAPAPTVVVAPQPVVQTVQPATVVVDSGPSYADVSAGIIGGVVGGIVEHALDHHHHRGHRRIGHRAPSPVSFGGRNCGPNRTVRAPRVQRSGNCGPNIRRGGHSRIVGGSAIIPGTKGHSMKGTMQRHQTIRPNLGGHHRPTGGNRGGRPSGGRGGRGGRR